MKFIVLVFLCAIVVSGFAAPAPAPAPAAMMGMSSNIMYPTPQGTSGLDTDAAEPKSDSMEKTQDRKRLIDWIKCLF